VCRNVNKIDEFSGHFKNLNLTYAERLKGFDPDGIFREHLLAVGFSSSFIHRHLTEDRDSDDNNPASGDCDGETFQSARLNCTDNREKYPVRRVPSPPLALPRA
jgi:hypothetical protein